MVADTSRRDDAIAWLKNCDAPAVVAHKGAMDALRAAAEAALDLKMDASSFMCARYPVDARGYVRHRDAAPTRPAGRKLTALYYLNPAWEASARRLRRRHRRRRRAVRAPRAGERPPRRLPVAPGARGPREPRRAPRGHVLVLQQARARPRAHRREAGAARARRLPSSLWCPSRESPRAGRRRAREEVFECERGCGFTGGFDAVATHEAACAGGS